MTLPKRLSTKQASEFTGRPEKTLRNWRWRKIGPPYFQQGNRCVYDLADLQKYMQARRVETTDLITQ